MIVEVLQLPMHLKLCFAKSARQNPILMLQNKLFVILADYVLLIVTNLNYIKGIVECLYFFANIYNKVSFVNIS